MKKAITFTLEFFVLLGMFGMFYFILLFADAIIAPMPV